jgi:nicotinamidase/pyrazinamidase
MANEALNPATTLFYDVDTQRDFIFPGGKLYVPGAERILPRLEDLTRGAQQKGLTIAGSVDRHFPTDVELQTNGGAYPEHCMDGTDGQRKVAATAPQHPCWIENRVYTAAELQALLRQGGEVYIEKQDIDIVVGNRNAAAVLDTLLRDKTDVVVYGVVTEICVDLVLAALKDRSVRLHVPVDAIAALDEKHAAETLEKWRRWGVRLTSTAEVLAEIGS